MPYVGIGAQNHQAAESLCGPHMLKVYAAIVAGILLTLAIAFLGKYHTDHPMIHQRPETVHDIHTAISGNLIENINVENIKTYLRVFTKEPHMAGTENNKKVAYAIADLWAQIGLEDVRMIPYEVLLSYPIWEEPSKLFIKDGAKIVFETTGMSPPITKNEQSAKYAGIQWLAYAAPGKIEGDVIFCNRGTENDFENLKKMGVDVKGKIALLRYGEGFRGDKVKIAQDFGAAGAILYSDPADVAADGIEKGHVYPDTIWMPADGVQRGTIMHGSGDPLTPLYPSRNDMYKYRTVNQAKKDGVLPSIPALPISYSTAYEILSRMDGRPVPISWQGAINVTYRIGPGMKNGLKVTINVKTEYKIKKIRNVIGTIRGHDEPDRYVMLGNHYDAWVYGSLDPNSGTAILSEVARSMMQTINETGWRPARSIVFCSWDGEEHGLLGSTEFVEEFADILSKRAVVYLNMDCLQGNSSLMVYTTPSLYGVAMNAAKNVPNPSKKEREKGRKTVYDTWIRTFPHPDDKSKPLMPVPNGGSDDASFLSYLGVPVVDFTYRNVTRRDEYPLYHTLYETPFLNEHLLDTDGFSIHKATGQYWAELARYFVDEAVIPFNVTQTAIEILQKYIPELKKAISPLHYFKDSINDVKQQLTNLAKTSQEFYHAAHHFENMIAFTKHSFEQNPYDVRNLNAVNDRLTGVERCFINPRGRPGAPASRHVLFSISSKDCYSGRTMAAIFDAIDVFKASVTSAERQAAGRELAQQINIVQYSVQCASNFLKEFI